MADGIIQSSASRYVSGRPSELSDQSAISGRAGVSLFTASLLALFVELALIRWIPSVVHVVGFFANVVLIASFLGLGVQPPRSSWGTLISDGAGVMGLFPWLVFFPAAILATVLFSLNFLGDGLRDALDPRFKGSGE